MRRHRSMTATHTIKSILILALSGRSKDGLCRIEQRNKFSVGETIEIMKPDGRNIEAEVLRHPE